MFKSEDQSLHVIGKRVADGRTIHADEAAGWGATLHACYLKKRINHSEAYSDGEAHQSSRKLSLADPPAEIEVYRIAGLRCLSECVAKRFLRGCLAWLGTNNPNMVSFIALVSNIANKAAACYINQRTGDEQMTALLERPVVLTQRDAELARHASQQLAAHHAEANLRVHLDDGQELTLPKAARDLLHHILREMGQGNAVTLIPVHAELTTQEAADYLNVSRPYLIRILGDGKLPFHMVGTHRRIKFSDLEAYRLKVEAERRAAMDDLATQAQELEMGY